MCKGSLSILFFDILVSFDLKLIVIHSVANKQLHTYNFLCYISFLLSSHINL